jgi:hypothetical protein
MVKRGCRLNSETEEVSSFKYYTQKTCIFECTLKIIIPSIVSMLNYVAKASNFALPFK